MDDSDKQRPEWAKELQEAGTCYCKRCEIFFQLKGALYDYGHASDLPSCLECGRGLFMLTGNWYPLLPVEYGLKS